MSQPPAARMTPELLDSGARVVTRNELSSFYTTQCV